MTTDVAQSLNKYLKTMLQDSHVIFIQQSIRKDRAYQQYSLESDNFHLIEGFELHCLGNVMRMSVEILELMNTAQKVIESGELEVQIPSSTEASPNDASGTNMSSSTSATDSPNDAIGMNICAATSATDDSICKHDEASSSNAIVSAALSPEKANITYTFEDYDSSLQILYRNNFNTQSSNTITTSIRFIEGSKGHNIKSDRPKIIYLPENLDDVYYITVVSLVLDHCCFQGRRSNPVCIGNSLKSAKMLNHGVKACGKETVVYIPYLQRRMATPDEKGEVLRTSNVLITDHKSFLGMEAESVVTIVDPTEKVICHSVVEILSRCASHLYIMVLSTGQQRKNGCVGDILSAWVTGNLVDTMFVTLDSGDKYGDKAIEVLDCSEDMKVFRNSKRFISISECVESLAEEEFLTYSTDEETR